jgi:hypothetical protein
MKIYISKPRKDGKRKAQYIFSNGVRITKLLTQEQIDQEIAKGTSILQSRLH